MLRKVEIEEMSSGQYYCGGSTNLHESGSVLIGNEKHVAQHLKKHVKAGDSVPFGLIEAYERRYRIRLLLVPFLWLNNKIGQWRFKNG